jgi:cystathionine beta-lyase/cystathionine gamma-synthase
MPETISQLPTPTPDRYATEAELTASLERKGTADPGDGLYPRDGTVEVTQVEAAISELTISGQERNVVVASGMAAVGGTVRFALQSKGREGAERPTLAYPPYLYTQSTRTFEGLRYMGVSATGYDPGDRDSVDRLFDNEKADVIFAETVSNTPDMPVLDVHHLLARVREAGKDSPTVILDNTLPLSTGIDFEELLTDEDPVIVVESATKGPLHNSEHLGVAYSANETLINGFRRYKATEGLVTSVNASGAILRSLEATTPDFHERNQALYASTSILARWISDAQMATRARGYAPDFAVSFPDLPDHANADYVARNMPRGTSPVVFVEHIDYTEGAAQRFLRELSEHPAVREQIEEGQVYLGQSFGFAEATLLYDPNATQIRIAGGYDIDSKALGKALHQALTER